MTGKRGKTPSDEGLMPDSESTGAERKPQDWFTVRTLIGCLLLLLAIDQFLFRMGQVPDRQELGPRYARVTFDPLGPGSGGKGPFSVAGRWRMDSEDPRFGGVSGLAVDRHHLVAVTDAGAVIRFPRPQGPETWALIKELPDGPLSGRFKANRDAEALVKDPRGLGWWVSFENFNQLWLYDSNFDRALRRFDLGGGGTTWNVGFEGAAFDGQDLLLVHETGGAYLRLGKLPPRRESIASAGRLSEVAALGQGLLVAIERRATPIGFSNQLVTLVDSGTGFEVGHRFALPAGPLENYEGLAVDRSGGKIRLWLITDDAFAQPFNTVLLALDVDSSWKAAD